LGLMSFSSFAEWGVHSFLVWIRIFRISEFSEFLSDWNEWFIFYFFI